MALKLFNTLSRSVQEFAPLSGNRDKILGYGKIVWRPDGGNPN